MKNKLNLSKSHVIPNGVDTKTFKPMDKTKCLKYVKFNPLQKNIVFAQPKQYVKNFTLADEAISLIKKYDVNLHLPSNIDHSEMPYYLNAADALLLTSFSEGSPNIVKEALACNCPIVATDVGDIKSIIYDLDGCFISSFSPMDIADKLIKAFEFSKTESIKGADKIKTLNLDSKHISEKIIALYHKIISSN